MATLSKGKTFTSGETVVPSKLHELVDNATVTYTSSGDTDNASLEVSGNKFQVKDAGITTAKINDAAVTTAKINDAAVTFAKQQSPQYTGFRNAIINGNFDIWQRGTSFTSAEYGADRWFHSRIGSTHTVSRESFTLGQTDVPNQPAYFCRTVVTSSAGAANLAYIAQGIESVRTFSGQSVTVSFYAKADAARPIAVELGQFFGAGGSASSSVNALGVTKTTLSTSWQKITVTTAIPSISGKTLGTDNRDHLFLNIWFDAGSNFNSRTDTLGQQSGTFDIAQVQVEAGSVATPLEVRPIGTELALCQRYFQKTYDLNTVAGTDLTSNPRGFVQGPINTSGSQAYAPLVYNLPVRMRAAPTLSYWDYAGNSQRFSTFPTTSISRTDNVNILNSSLQSETVVTLIPLLNANTYAAAALTMSAEF
jgi:hypothetical protein